MVNLYKFLWGTTCTQVQHAPHIITIPDYAHIALSHHDLVHAHVFLHIGRSANVIIHDNRQIDVSSYQSFTAHLQEHAQFTMIQCSTIVAGDHEWHINLRLAQDAQAHYHGAATITKSARVALITRQIHQGAQSTSTTDIHVVCRQTAAFAHHGTINITPHAPQSSASQQTHVLLVGQTARAYAEPVLEIAQHDVQCHHASAIGTLDDDQLLYLQSRGLSQEQATEIIIDGFLSASRYTPTVLLPTSHFVLRRAGEANGIVSARPARPS